MNFIKDLQCQSMANNLLSKDYVICDHVIYSADYKSLIHCARNISGFFEIPQQVEIIGIDAFARCKGLTSIILPKNTQKIEMLAFANCTALSKISITTPQTIAVAIAAFDSIHFENCAGSSFWSKTQLHQCKYMAEI